MLGDQYMLSNLLRETPDTIVYGAQQKDIRRDVIIESLRPEAMADDDKVSFFLRTAKAQSRMKPKNVATALELFFMDESWHLAKEKIAGEPLDMLLSRGEKLSSPMMCELLMQLCHICLYMDVEGIASIPFALEDCYLMGHDFRFANMAVAGERLRSASGLTLQAAARAVLPLLDTASPMASAVQELLQRIEYAESWETLTPVYYAEELTQLNLRIIWMPGEEEGDANK